MSALDEAVSRFPFDASDNVSRETHDRFIAEARAELELLREAAFEMCYSVMSSRDKTEGLCHSCGWGSGGKTLHVDECDFARILRTDPDRAKKLGLGWAL